MVATRNSDSRQAEDQARAVLTVFKSITVGPVELTPDKLSAPYTVVFPDGRSEHTKLSFRWEEDVFTPGENESENLAALIAVQPVLNYGLFAQEIVCRGRFDRVDGRFLADMLENTSREILVNKILRPSPFLKPEAATLKPFQSRSYTTAKLVFPDSVPTSQAEPWGSGDTTSRHLLLSSGGKESLLTCGLLEELGREVHHAYINESGRHWYTAINGYRHHRSTNPNTGRVWTDVDRLYNWMLRLFPFIRPDYARIRADDYPIRLWTVAVLIFAGLPLARKRGLSRVLVGDEYDTTRRLNYKGITHYDGLFDQSRYFDNALSRFYHRKGWKLAQFSLLRPVSELLIQTVLATRYANLQEHQVSCHAAHIEEQRVKPCGRCEKCRRIVAMLSAAGLSPQRCGYTEAQIEDCLKALAGMKLHHEKEVTQQLMFMLQQRKTMFTDRKPFRPRPEVLKLRFDGERSPPESIPRELRAGLYSLLLEYADGALVKSGRTWKEVNCLSEAFLSRPYPFEDSEQQAIDTGHEYLLSELSWPEAKRRFAEVDIALLPVGAIEQHGPHLPVDTDAFDADYLAREVANRCSRPCPLVLPLVPYGVSYHHEDFPGTIPISPDTLARIVYEIGVAVARSGITKLVIVNGHGGNVPALNFAAQKINRDVSIFTCVESGDTSDVDICALLDAENDVHAGEIETSTSLANRPHLVKMDRAVPFVPRFSNRYLDFSSRRSVEWYARTSLISETGVLGDPTRATAQKGHEIWQLVLDNLVRFVEELKSLSLDEIHQRRY